MMEIFNLSSNKKIIIPLITFGVFLASCNNNSSHSGESETAIDSAQSKTIKISNKIYSIPSPIQFTTLLKEGGAIYDASFLNKTTKTDQYLTNSSKALNLGIFGADLSYTIIYNQTQDAFEHLGAIKSLAEDLDLNGVFNNNLLERFKINIGNSDSLYTIISKAYLMGNAHLKNYEQTDISGLILTGSWIESLHLATYTYKTFPTEAIKIRIAQQRLSLNSIINSLKQTGGSEQLIAELNDLKIVYDNISIKYKFLESSTDSKNKLTTINSETKIEITQDQIEKITEKINTIRTKIVNGH